MQVVRQDDFNQPLGCDECDIEPGDRVEITDEQVWLCKDCLLKAVRMLNGEGEEGEEKTDG